MSLFVMPAERLMQVFCGQTSARDEIKDAWSHRCVNTRRRGRHLDVDLEAFYYSIHCDTSLLI